MRHQEYSGKKLEYFDQPNNKRFVPFVVETSVGADRTTLAVLVNAYKEEKVEGEDEGRTVLALHPSLAPIKAGIFPLVKKDGMPEFAEKLTKDLRKRFSVFYDESGAIGRRYRRQDEVGTPYCLTVDGQTIADGTVTIRNRDTLQQERVAAEHVGDIITARLQS
jgi:glycyl-tRNA synthetase